eukprot:NP_493735.2 Uncharacterized protein CELE_C24H12.2 [Caenorhabditis elegans]
MGPTTFGGIENAANSEESPLKKEQTSDENESSTQHSSQETDRAGFQFLEVHGSKKSSTIFAKAGTQCTEYVLKLEGGPVLPHCAEMMTQFIRSTKLCSTEEKPVTMQVMDRHTSQGMSDWTDGATNWNTVTIAENCVKLTKN